MGVACVNNMASSGKNLVRSKSGLRMVASNQTKGSPFCTVEPPWIPDNEVCFQK